MLIEMLIEMTGFVLRNFDSSHVHPPSCEFCNLNSVFSDSALKRMLTSHFVCFESVHVLKLLHYIMKEDETETREPFCNMAWCNGSLTHPLKHTRWNAAFTNCTPRPPDILFAIEQQSVSCLNHPDMLGIQNSINTRGYKNVFWNIYFTASLQK